MKTNRLTTRILLLLTALITTTAFAGAANTPAPAQKHPILIRGGTIHTVSGDTIEGGSLLLVEGKIAEILAKEQKLNLPANTNIIDAKGKHIYPGLISANTVLGLTEISAVRATNDTAEPGSINPNARTEVSVNPDSELLPVTRSNGVLNVLVAPRAGTDLLAGTSALMRLDGWTWEDMTVRAPVGMHVFWPRSRSVSRFRASVSKDAANDRRKKSEERIQVLRDSLQQARAYIKSRDAEPNSQPTDLRWESLRSVIAGQTPLFVHATDTEQIQAALSFTREQKVKLVIVGGNDAWRLAPLLKEHDVPVILTGIHSLPLRRWEAYNTPFETPAKLHKAGVRFCIAGPGGTFEAAHERNLPYMAGIAAAHGLPKEEALKAVTLYPAEILGVGKSLGSLEVEKEATLIITNGDPLEITTKVEHAFIQGRKIDLSNKQTRLAEKYREKYRQLGGGK